MGPEPVGVQCSHTSSLGEFPGYWDWLCMVSWAFACVGVHRLFTSPSIPGCFSIHSSLPAIEFHVSSLRLMYLHFRTYRSTLHLHIFRLFPRLWYPMLWFQRRSTGAHEAEILFQISVLAGV